MARRRSLGTPVCLGLLSIFLPVLVVGQPASLLLDINQTAYDFPLPLPREVRDLRAVGNRLYFRTSAEIWVSDGTPAGTESLCPGRCSSQPEFLGGLGRLMLWTAESPAFGRQLWRSDGSRPETFALTEPDLQVTPPTAFEGHLLSAFVGRSFYFVGCSGAGAANDCDLWRTDGTVSGTRIFQEAPRGISWLQAAGDRLYYLEVAGRSADLWVTDGTAAGTVRLRHFEGEFRDFPRLPVAAGDRLFFQARSAGDEIWTSDGTAVGTRPVTNFAVDSPFWYGPQPAGGRVYFIADDGVHGRELWRADGTAAGTVRFTDFAPEDPFLLTSDVSILGEVGGTVVFRASDGQRGLRLWTSRGTLQSTAPLAVPCEDCQIYPYTSLVQSGGRIFVVADRNHSIPELWVTDGTAAGSRKIWELCCGSVNALVPSAGGVLFSIGSQNEQIWFSNGTRAGTKPLTPLMDVADNPLEVAEVGGDLYFLTEGETTGLWVRDARKETRPVRTFPISGPTSEPRLLGSSGNRLLFTAWDGTDSFGLWSSAGTPETTAPLILPLSRPDVSWDDAREPVQAAGLLFFQIGPGNDRHELWRSDGTLQGTFPLASLLGQSVAVPFQGSLYFFDGREIWRTDGTIQGTIKTGDLPADLRSVEVAAPGPNGMYLKTVTEPGKSEFWLTDGTGAGTRQLTDLNASGVAGWEPEFTTVGSHVYFSWLDSLWKTDGTAAGTTALPIPAGESATKLIAHQGALYFFTMGFFSADHDLRLWRTDGTTAGMVELARFPFQNTFLFPLKLTPFAGKLYFNVDDGVHGTELWATDGTPAGTALVRDVLPGPRSSSPIELTVGGGRLFFTADDLLHGQELWETDGTAAGTRLVQDIRPQVDSSALSQLTVAGDKLFFKADDGVTGEEVWVLPLAGTAACRSTSTRLCLGGGRYAVEAAWRDFQGRRGAGHAVPLTADTGYFWFFDPANVEAVLKVLDGRGANGHVWVFYGALSNVEYTLTVTDTQTGLARRYVNPSGVLASVGDTLAFGPHGASAQAVAESVSRPSPLALVDRRVVPAAATGSCAPSSTRLCLNGSRFAVEIAWKDFAGNQGAGQAVELTDDTGWFWFFDAANVEVVLKVLDGTPVNGHHWVFYGALSSVEYTVTVTDTQTGEINTYKNTSGRLASVADTRAF